MRDLDELRAEKERLAVAEPFAELAMAARSMIIHLESVEACADELSHGIQGRRPKDWTVEKAHGIREHILDDYRKLADELHAAVDRVMRTALVDEAARWTPPAPEPPRVEAAAPRSGVERDEEYDG